MLESHPRLNKYTLNRKIFNLNDLSLQDVPKHLLHKQTKNLETMANKLSEALLWHSRFGHASVRI